MHSGNALLYGDLAFRFVITYRHCAPFFLPGDVVVIDPDTEPQPGNMVLAAIYTEDGFAPLFGRFLVDDGGTGMVAMLDETVSEPFELIGEDFIVGTATEHSIPARRVDPRAH